jgi:hypothetical protein
VYLESKTKLLVFRAHLLRKCGDLVQGSSISLAQQVKNEGEHLASKKAPHLPKPYPYKYLLLNQVVILSPQLAAQQANAERAILPIFDT